MTLHDQHTDLHDSENYFDKLTNQLAAGMSSDSTVTTPEPTLADTLNEMAGCTETVNEDLLIEALRYASQHLAKEHCEHISAILNP